VKPTFEDIRELVESWESLSPPENRTRLLGQLDEMGPGDPGRAEILNILGTQTGLDPTEEWLDLTRAAQADGGPTTLDPRVNTLWVLVQLGRDEEADALTKELLRAPGRDDVLVGLHAYLGDILEDAGRLQAAHRAFTVGLRDFEPEEDEPTVDEDLCLVGRYRVRRELGLGSDTLDRWVEADQPEAAAAIRERARSGSGPGV
jgi:hypothetical protein